LSTRPTSEAKPLRTDFDRSITYFVTALANKLSNSTSRRVRHKLHIGLMEWRALTLLAVEGEVSPARIAQVAGVDKSVVSRAVNALEKAGLIVVSADGLPGRQTRLKLTETGLALHDVGAVDSAEVEHDLLEGFSEAERELFVSLLKRMTANFAARERRSA